MLHVTKGATNRADFIASLTSSRWAAVRTDAKLVRCLDARIALGIRKAFSKGFQL